ncbi:Methyltransferase domain-containing protein [Sulfitobacter brevis]|uniref:Methyltransferase domain-containing protein n=1 Tax=Sulfitobacter brevis TaxID=74348 RepID=A0A1I2FFE4_9RHOB|nr:class I SAM-dependent methyltransferase [Sulfitobacter brevis]SFF03236.1 Methyltransferase domain-containing protein [Sulfitobacter brevis]
MELNKNDDTDLRALLHATLVDVDALMSRAVYDALFDAAAAQGPAQVLEIGTAHGAGTIALALGGASRGHDIRIATVDTLQALPDIPSSRARFGGPAENEAIVRGNFRRAGVGDRIDLHVGRSEDFARKLPDEFSIDMLVLDADGRIDRDLALFGPYLAPGATVIVDDIDGKVGAALRGGRLAIDLKHVISEKLTARLVEEGYLKFEKRTIDTSFFRAPDPQNWDYARLSEIAIASYRELIFLETAISPVMASSIASLLSSKSFLRPLYGGARAIYRRLSNRGNKQD